MATHDGRTPDGSAHDRRTLDAPGSGGVRPTVTLHLTTESAVAQLGVRFAARLHGTEYVALRGPLGAGKTSFARAVLRALGHAGTVRSPSFTLVEPYAFDHMQVLHLDLYRLRGPQELEMLGVREQFGDAVVLIEWPENGAPWLPVPDIELQFDYAPVGRRLDAVAMTAAGEHLLAGLSGAA